MRPQGFVTISKLTRPDGRELSTQEAVDKGLIKPLARKPSGWGIQKHEIPLGHNLFTDEGRQTMAYAFGFRSPIVNYVCTLPAVRLTASTSLYPRRHFRILSLST